MKCKKLVGLCLSAVMATGIAAIPAAATVEVSAEGMLAVDFADFVANPKKSTVGGVDQYYPNQWILGDCNSSGYAKKTLAEPATEQSAHKEVLRLNAPNHSVDTYLLSWFNQPYKTGHLKVSYDIKFESFDDAGSFYAGILPDDEYRKAFVKQANINNTWIDGSTWYPYMFDESYAKWYVDGNYTDGGVVNGFAVRPIRNLLNFKMNEESLTPFYTKNNPAGGNYYWNFEQQAYPYYSDELPDFDTWYTVESYIDLAYGTVTTYFNGALIYQNVQMPACGGVSAGVNGLIFRFGKGTNNSSVLIDNVAVKHSESQMNSVYAEMVTKEVQPASTLSFVLSDAMRKPLKQSDITIVNSVTNNEITDFTVSSTTKSFDIKANGLDYKQTYTILFSDELKSKSLGESIAPVSFTTAPRKAKQYLAYENFNGIKDGELPAGISASAKNSDSASARVGASANAADNSSAMKITNGSTFRVYKEFTDKVTGAADDSDTLVVEFDMKSHNGGMYINIFTEDTLNTWQGWLDAKRIFVLPATTESSVNTMRVMSANGYDSMSKEYTAYNQPQPFKSFDEWVHVRGTINMPEVVKDDCRQQQAQLLWTITDSSGESYMIRDFNFDVNLPTPAHTTYPAQTDIMGIGFGVLEGTGDALPALEIDNLEVYKANSSMAEAPDVASVSFGIGGSYTEQAPAAADSVALTFTQAMDASVAKYIMITCNSEEIAFTSALSDDGKTLVITPENPLEAQTQYKLTVSGAALSADGGALEADFVRSFTTGSGIYNVDSITVTNASGEVLDFGSISDSDTLTVTVSGRKTVKEDKKLLIILAGYKGNDMKFVKSVITAPDSGSFTKMLENISIDKSGIDQIKAYCWDAETYKPMIPHKTI